MATAAEELIKDTIRRAYLPDTVADHEALVSLAVCVFADNLSERGTRQLAEWLGAPLQADVQQRADKLERSVDEMIDLIASEAGVVSAIADDVLGAMLESLWRVLDRDQVDALIAQVPSDVSRTLMAAIPGEARGKF